MFVRIIKVRMSSRQIKSQNMTLRDYLINYNKFKGRSSQSYKLDKTEKTPTQMLQFMIQDLLSFISPLLKVPHAISSVEGKLKDISDLFNKTLMKSNVNSIHFEDEKAQSQLIAHEKTANKLDICSMPKIVKKFDLNSSFDSEELSTIKANSPRKLFSPQKIRESVLCITDQEEMLRLMKSVPGQMEEPRKDIGVEENVPPKIYINKEPFAKGKQLTRKQIRLRL